MNRFDPLAPATPPEMERGLRQHPLPRPAPMPAHLFQSSSPFLPAPTPLPQHPLPPILNTYSPTPFRDGPFFTPPAADARPFHAPTVPDYIPPPSPEVPARDMDYLTQEETMSDTDEAGLDLERWPMADSDVDPDDLVVAQRELLAVGVDTDAAGAVAEKTRGAAGDVMHALTHLQKQRLRIDEAAAQYHAALRIIQQQLDGGGRADEEGRDVLLPDHRDPLLQCEGILVDLVGRTHQHKDTATKEAALLNAKLVLLQNVGRTLAEKSPLPCCPICYTRPVECACQPCGHTFCATCCSTMLSSRGRKSCYVCKQRGKGSIRLHF